MADSLDKVRALAIAARPCPWCGTVAWDTGAYVMVLVGEWTAPGAINFSTAPPEEIPEQIRVQAQFVCTACAYVVTFQPKTTPIASHQAT